MPFSIGCGWFREKMSAIFGKTFNKRFLWPTSCVKRLTSVLAPTDGPTIQSDRLTSEKNCSTTHGTVRHFQRSVHHFNIFVQHEKSFNRHGRENNLHHGKNVHHRKKNVHHRFRHPTSGTECLKSGPESVRGGGRQCRKLVLEKVRGSERAVKNFGRQAKAKGKP